MKTQIITLFTALLLSTGIAATTQAAPVKNETVTVLTDISAISKIEIYGNVELYVSDGQKDQVKVYNKYYSESALVQSKNGVLRISSYKAEKLIVWVTAADLRSIAAYDNAEVRSFGNLSKIELEVSLHNNASAKLNLDAFSANIIVSDQAKANLSGTVEQYDLKCSHPENVNQTSLVAKHAAKTPIQPVTANKVDIEALADLF
ncbi:MAG: hypothetical protein JWR02_1995 [Mucilaginibacter sp.]|nr:hypothetical protein [Mucilaginibacter sp.]